MKERNDTVKTVLVISVGFAIVFLITNWYWTIIVSISIGVLGILSQRICDRVNFIWMKIAWLLSLIIPKIVLSFIYYLLLFPLAILSRKIGKKDTMHLKNNSTSMWINRDSQFKKSSFDKTW